MSNTNTSGLDWVPSDDEYNKEGTGADAKRFPPFTYNGKTYFFAAVLPYHRRIDGVLNKPFRAVRIHLVEMQHVSPIVYGENPDGTPDLRPGGRNEIERAFNPEYVYPGLYKHFLEVLQSEWMQAHLAVIELERDAER
jgi:hypothetical protein